MVEVFSLGLGLLTGAAIEMGNDGYVLTRQDLAKLGLDRAPPGWYWLDNAALAVPRHGQVYMAGPYPTQAAAEAAGKAGQADVSVGRWARRQAGRE